jgi:hypothetical protein
MKNDEKKRKKKNPIPENAWIKAGKPDRAYIDQLEKSSI